MTNNQDSKNNNQPTNEEPQINDLRSKVKKTLKRFVNNKEASNKEMEIFDKTVSRRSFLGGTFKLSAVAALVGQGLVPSAFAARNPEFALPSQEMPILTAELKAEITTAAKIQVSSDVVDGVLKHRHIEHTEAKEFEDTLEALNTVVRAQESFENPDLVMEKFGDNANRTFGHPELVRLQNSSLSADSPYMHNGHELVLYEYNTDQTAPVKKRTIQLPTNYPKDLVLNITKETGTFEMRKGDEIQNKYFRLVYLPDSGNMEVYSKDSDKHCWTLFMASDYPEADVFAIQPDGRAALYSKDGKFIVDLARTIGTKQNVVVKFTQTSKFELYSEEECYYSIGTETQVDKSVFENYAKEDFDYNRVVSINGHKHNTIVNDKVKNQKMILVAKQSVEGSWDGSPSKWIEHTSEMTTCWEQMRLYVQNSLHDVHRPEDSSRLKAVFDQGSIADSSGEKWHVYNPLAILQKELSKLRQNRIGLRVMGSGFDDKEVNVDLPEFVQLTIEDIGKFEQGNSFSCLYGTVKLNLWCNLGFYIYFDDSKEHPVVKFTSINNKHRYEYLYYSSIEKGKSIKYFDQLYHKTLKLKSDSDLSDKHPKLAHALLRNDNRRSFIEQIFRPFGYISDVYDQADASLVIAYNCMHNEDGKVNFNHSVAMHRLPLDSRDEIYLSEIEKESYLQGPDQKTTTQKTPCIYRAPIEGATGKIYTSTVDLHWNDKLYNCLFGDHLNGVKSLFQVREWEDPWGKKYLRMYHNDCSTSDTNGFLMIQETLLNTTPFVLSPHAVFTVDRHRRHSLQNIRSSFEDIIAKDCIKSSSVKKIHFSTGLTGAARYIVHTSEGGLYIFKQAIESIKLPSGELDPYAPPMIEGYESGYAIEWEREYTQISAPKSGNDIYCQTARMLDWTKYASDNELILVQDSKRNIENEAQTKYRVATEYKYLTKEIVEQTWHDHVIQAQVSASEEHATEHHEKATIYDVEMQAINVYDKPCSLSDNQSFEIRFAQPCYFEIFSGNQRNVGCYAKRNESYFVQADASGRALVQVKAPALDRLSGITLSYRVIDGRKFMQATASPLLRLKNDVEDIHAWQQINLAYNVHKRLDNQSENSNSELRKKVKGNLAEEYKTDETQKKIYKGLKDAGTKLTEASDNSKAAFKAAPNLIFNPRLNANLLEQTNNPIVNINPAYSGAWQAPSYNEQRLGGWLSDTWKKVCDFAIAVLNKIKEAIKWVQKQLETLLDELAKLNIPGISDIAKIAKGIVGFIGTVLTKIVDVAIMIVNILKYIFDFDVALDIGKEMLKLFKTGVFFASSLANQSSKLLRDTSTDLNALVKGCDAKDLKDLDNNHASSIQDNDESAKFSGIENVNYAQNAIDKNVPSDTGSEKMHQLQALLQNETIVGASELEGIAKDMAAKSSSLPVNPKTGVSAESIYGANKGFDFNSILDLLKQATSSMASLGFEAIKEVFSLLESIKIPGWISDILNFLLGVRLRNFIDIGCLLIGYPLMLISEVVSGVSKAFGKDFNLLADLRTANKAIFPGNKQVSQNLQAYHKDTLLRIAYALDGLNLIFLTAVETVIIAKDIQEFKQRSNKSPFSILLKVFLLWIPKFAPVALEFIATKVDLYKLVIDLRNLGIMSYAGLWAGGALLDSFDVPLKEEPIVFDQLTSTKELRVLGDIRTVVSTIGLLALLVDLADRMGNDAVTKIIMCVAGTLDTVLAIVSAIICGVECRDEMPTDLQLFLARDVFSSASGALYSAMYVTKDPETQAVLGLGGYLMANARVSMNIALAST